MRAPNEEHSHWIDSPSTHNLIFFSLAVICAVLAIGDFLHWYHRHHDQPYQEWPLFYPIFGFAAYSFIVITAKGLRRLISREEDYYDN